MNFFVTVEYMYFAFQNLNSQFIAKFVLFKTENFKMASKYKANLLEN